MNHGIDILKLWEAAGTFARGVIVIMAIMSLWSLSVAITKLILIRKSQSATKKLDRKSVV